MIKMNFMTTFIPFVKEALWWREKSHHLIQLTGAHPSLCLAKRIRIFIPMINGMKAKNPRRCRRDIYIRIGPKFPSAKSLNTNDIIGKDIEL